MTLSIDCFPDNNLEEGAQLYCTVFNEPPWNDEWEDKTAQLRLAEMIKTPGYRGYSACLDDQIIGMVMGNLEQWYTGKHYYLKEMFIHPSQQRRWFGTVLIEHLIAKLTSENVERVYLLTMQESPARSFYERNRFQLNKRMGMQSLQLEK